jgi:hypothetical protein
MTAVVSVSRRGARPGGFKSAGPVRLGTRDRGRSNRFPARQTAGPSFRESPTAESHTTILNERNHSMNTKNHTVLVGLAVCALALAALGSAKNPVRPIKWVGHLTITVNLTDGTWQTQDWGTSSHLGKFTNHAEGTGFGTVGMAGTGTATAANGDQLFWKTPGATSQAEWAGGTGRFEHATGRFSWTPSMEPITTFPDATTMVISYPYDAEGIIAY